MKRKLLILCALLSFSSGTIWAQVTGVSTNPENKKAIVEEFSGVNCVNCPAGHQVLDQMKTTYGSDVYIITFMPNNSNFTTPQPGDPDLRRAYPAAFYSTPFCGSSRFMPSAFINRREWSAGEKISSRSIWSASAGTIIGEMSPVNVGVIAEYDETTKMLTITVENYYTSTVTDQHSLYVTLAENGIFTQQSGASGPYEQFHVFREAFTGQWGDAIATTTMGQLNSTTYTFDNSTANYDMSKCEVMAYIENKTNAEIVTGSGAAVTPPMVAVEEQEVFAVNVFPNPFSGATALTYTLSNAEEVSYQIVDLAGQEVMSANLGNQNAGNHRIDIDAAQAGLSSGIYFVRLNAGNAAAVKRLAVQ